MSDIINKGKARLYACLSPNVTSLTLRSASMCVGYLNRV